MNAGNPEIPHQSPITPEMLTEDSKFNFRCHKEISRFDACCKNIDIQLTPYDFYRLKMRMKENSELTKKAAQKSAEDFAKKQEGNET